MPASKDDNGKPGTIHGCEGAGKAMGKWHTLYKPGVFISGKTPYGVLSIHFFCGCKNSHSVLEAFADGFKLVFLP